MDDYIIGVKPWGLYVSVCKSMGPSKIPAFLADLEHTYGCLAKTSGGWRAIYDFRECPVALIDPQEHEILGHLARQLGEGRSAIIVGSPEAAAMMQAINSGCGLAGRSRVILANRTRQDGVREAYAYVLEGVEPR